jgi:hypothetical protein
VLFRSFLTGRLFGVVAMMAGVYYVARRYFEPYEVQEWLWETWRFVRQIFPLLVVGVFAVGVIRRLIRPEWIGAVAGHNTVFGNLAGVIFGVFLYFPTLVEVPIAKMFLSLGMHRGPLVAYLMADPELSLQSILMIAAIIGRRKAWTYAGLVALFSTLSGLIYGAWVDGASLWMLAVYLVASLSVLAVGLYLVDRRNRRLAALAEGQKRRERGSHEGRDRRHPCRGLRFRHAGARCRRRRLYRASGDREQLR